MSSKSANKSTHQKNPYGNPSRRGRGKILIATVIVLAMGTAAWISAYTNSVGEATAAGIPNSQTQQVDPSQMPKDSQ